jgi:hypothetical protein
MRRSSCPSQINQMQSIPSILEQRSGASLFSTNKSNNRQNDDIVIKRVPLFSFLEVPDNLSKQFRIPGGCILTEKYRTFF